MQMYESIPLELATHKFVNTKNRGVIF
jgi:hypothetical protein